MSEMSPTSKITEGYVMNSNGQLCVKLIHCGNSNIANPEDTSDKNIFFMPMGLFPLAKALKDKGFDSEIIHLDLEKGNDIEDIIDFNTLDVVGFDCHWVNQGLVVLDAAALIKKIKPQVFVFLGGFTASLFADEIVAKYPQIDAVIRGDGEIPIVELCSKIKAGLLENYPQGNLELGKVQNLVWKRGTDIKNNEFSYSGTPEEMEKLDFAAVDMLRHWEYYQLFSKFWTRFEPIASSPMFLLEMGRGCPYACSFCGGNCEAQSRMNNRRKPIIRSVESAVKTVKKAKSLGYETFYTSFEYEGSDKWYIEFFEQLKREGISISYIFGSWKLPSKELIDSLSSNCTNVIFEISPETFSESIRIENKDSRLFYSNSQLEECLEYIKAKGNIRVQLYYGYFLAYDDSRSVMDTIRYIMEVSLKYSEILEAEYFNFSTDPGSLLFFFPEKYDIDIQVRNFEDYIKYIGQKYINEKSGAPDMRIFKPKAISDEEVAVLETRIKLFNYLFSSYRKTISYILKKTGNADAVLKVIEAADSCRNKEGLFISEVVKEKIIKICIDSSIMDSQIMQIVKEDLDGSKAKSQSLKATPQIWLDFGHECDVKDEDMDEYLVLMENEAAVGQEVLIDFSF